MELSIHYGSRLLTGTVRRSPIHFPERPAPRRAGGELDFYILAWRRSNEEFHQSFLDRILWRRFFFSGPGVGVSVTPGFIGALGVSNVGGRF